MWTYFYPFIPPIPNTNEKPPTIYSILNSYCNYGKSEFDEEYIKPADLAKYGKAAIFDFDFPISNKVNIDAFEEMILNKFLMRRIGYETLSAFKIALNVKLNEIMPKYNKLFDSYINWDLFKDGEITTRSFNENRSDSGSSSSESSSDSTSDRRFSNVPQNEIQDVKNGTYMTDYNLDTDEISTTNNGQSQTNGNTSVLETISRTPSDKFELYKKMLDDEKNIYTLIFKDLSVLFYNLV